MPSVRTYAVAAVALAVATAILAAFAVQQGCTARAAVPAPVPVPSDVHLADAEAADAAAASFRGRQDIASVADAGRLEAARTVAAYCHLIDEGQFARAGELCARRRLWSRRALGALTGFRFRSARVYAAPDARTLVLKARVHVHAGRGCPLPDGLAVVYFTLGRAGSTVGGWQITAVSTRP
jgi:hypothetical protein